MKERVASATDGAVKDASLNSLTGILQNPLSHDPEKFADLLTSASPRNGNPVQARDALEVNLWNCLTLAVNGRAISSVENGTAVVTALCVVDAAIVLFSRQLISADLPGLLLQLVLLFAPISQLQEAVDQLKASFHLFGEASSEMKSGIARLGVAKAVILCLRRASFSDNHVLSGKLRTCLMSSLPCWDKSGINKKGLFNADNETVLASTGETTTTQFGSLGEEHSRANTNKAQPEELAIYESFWGIQKYLSNPDMCENADTWAEFRGHVNTILSAFDSIPIQTSPAPPGPETRWPKFLTSKSLLRLQLSDVYLRRNVLVQLAILLQHLELNVDVLAPRDEKLAKYWTEQFTSDSNGRGDGVKLLSRVLSQLSGLDDDRACGLKGFLLSVLARETKWIEWKNHGCRANNPAEDGLDANSSSSKRPALWLPEKSDFDTSSKIDFSLLDFKLERMRFGEQGKVANVAVSLADSPFHASPRREIDIADFTQRESLLRPAKMFSYSSLDDIKKQLIEEDEDGLEDEYKSWNKPAFAWQSMRALSENNSDSFIDLACTNSTSEYPPFDLRRLVEGALSSSAFQHPERTDGSDGDESRNAGHSHSRDRSEEDDERDAGGGEQDIRNEGQPDIASEGRDVSAPSQTPAKAKETGDNSRESVGSKRPSPYSDLNESPERDQESTPVYKQNSSSRAHSPRWSNRGRRKRRE